MRAKRSVAVSAAVLALVCLLGSCADAGEDRASVAMDEAASAEGSDALAAELNKGPAAGRQLEVRQVVYTGSMTLRVKDVESAADAARKIADDAGGFVSAQDSQLEGDREITVTLRVPADRFEEASAEAAKLGTVRARSVDSEDVTDQVVDLKGRLENAQASAQRLRELLADADVLDHVVALEDRLAQRESDIEQLMGQLEVLQDQVGLATLSLTLTERDAPQVSDDLPGPLDALRAGAVAVGNIALVAVAAVAFLLPFSPFVLAGWWIWRRTKPRRAARREARRVPLAPPYGWPGAAPAPPTGAGPVPDGPENDAAAGSGDRSAAEATSDDSQR